MAGKEGEPLVDCVAYDPAPFINFRSTNEEGTFVLGSEAGYCYHPGLVRPGDTGALCEVVWGNGTCDLMVPNDSSEAEELRQRIIAAREVTKPKTFEEIW